MKHIIFLTFLFFSLTLHSQKLETFILTNGETITGEVLDDDNGAIIIRTEQGKTVTVYKADIKNYEVKKDNTSIIKQDSIPIIKTKTKIDYNAPPKITRGGLTVGYASASLVTFEIYLAGESGWGAAFDAGFNVNKGTKGEKMENVSFSEFTDDIKEKGSYYNTYHFGLAKHINHFYFIGLVGLAQHIKYENRYDSFKILGDNGTYYVQDTDRMSIDYGGEIGFNLGGFMIGLCVTQYNGIGGKIGFLL